jgi:hypothetical protein
MYGLAVAWGMSAAAPDAPERNKAQFDILWKHLGKGPHRTEWDNAQWVDDSHGLTMGLTFCDPHGESATTYFEYDATLDGHWYSDREDMEHSVLPSFVGCRNPDRQVERHLVDRLDVGRPCDCGICRQGGDCCGQWFAHSLDIWPASTEFGEFRWYGKVYSSRNI